MPLLFIRLSLVLGILFMGSTASMQNVDNDAILFVWNDVLFSQAINSSELVKTQLYFGGQQSLPPTQQRSIFDFQSSPLNDAPIDNYGFYQGVWSADQSLFAFLAIQPNGVGYHVIVVVGGQQRLLFSGEVNLERGYLVPVGWADDGSVILLERHMLHNLREVKLWQYNDVDSSLSLRQTIDIPDLKGNSASLEDGWVFIGFDTVGVLGYLINLYTGELVRFPTSFALQDPPASVFEVYPVSVVGVVNTVEFKVWLEHVPAPDNSSASIDQLVSNPPFLYWPLPDHARSITCYPDSEWTDLHFAVECPGLTVPREYQGHEGTDIGGKPNGLEIGTQVYAAARGLVIKQNSGCESEDITCGEAYGNYILLEHSIVIDHNIETWFTGYAHLQRVLVNQYDYINEIGIPIALSGATGLGGAHLHFEVRSPLEPIRTNWIDPWDPRISPGETGLWIGGTAHPESAVVAAPPTGQLICQTAEGNNIRNGPGTEYALVAKSQVQTDYEVFQIQRITSGTTPGDWYHVRWPGTDSTGWIYSNLLTDCKPIIAP